MQPPDVDALIKRITDAPDQDLVAVLHPVQIWKFARGDMHAWVPVTKRFIEILTRMRDSYSFGAGSSKPSKLQLNDFTPKDKELIREILRFIRLLMENCTNRKLFDGYEVSTQSAAKLTPRCSTTSFLPMISMCSMQHSWCSFAPCSSTSLRCLPAQS